MTDEEYLDWLRDECRYIQPMPTGDGRWTAISKMIYTSAILIGDMHDFVGHNDRWCYSTPKAACFFRDMWAIRGYEGEPLGWHRHPASGRRREGGNIDKETVRS
jgi:hypothetical protein